MDDSAVLDLEKVEAFSEQMLGILNAGMAASMVSIGHQVGLFDTMADRRSPATSQEIADAVGSNPS